MLSKRIQAISESVTLAISSKAAILKAEGKDILSFSAGEPDFDTPKVIKDFAIKAINDGFTNYTPVDGILELREAIRDKLKRDHNIEYKVNQIITSNGAKHSLFNIFEALIEDGDEVIVPSPYWVTYPELVKFANGKLITIKTSYEDSYKIKPEQLKNSLSPRTKILILNSPSNPTGSIYSREELEAIGEVLKGTKVFVISDEMYEKLTFEGSFVSSPSVSEDMYHRTILVNGLSKCVAMTGWRFGYLASPNVDIISAIKRLQSHSTSNINSITQKASIVGLSKEIDEEIELMKKEFIKRRDLAFESLSEIKGFRVFKPQGAFYLFVDISNIENDSLKFCAKLLEDKLVALVPGVGFGSDGHFRFSFATDILSIKEGIARIKDFVANNY